MKTTLICLAIAICARLTFEAVIAQTVETPTAKTEHVVAWQGAVTFEGKIANKWHYWLWVSRANLRDYEERGYDPSYTFIVSTYKPVPKQRPDGLWEVTFQSAP